MLFLERVTKNTLRALAQLIANSNVTKNHAKLMGKYSDLLPTTYLTKLQSQETQEQRNSRIV